MVKKNRLWFSIWILKLSNRKFRFRCLSLWFRSFINLSVSSFHIHDNFSSIVSICYSGLTFQYFLFHWVIKSTFPDIDWLLRSSWNEIITFSAEFCIIGVSLKSILKFTFLRIPYFCCSIIRWRDQIRTMRMKIYGFDWTLMTFINLNNMLWS